MDRSCPHQTNAAPTLIIEPRKRLFDLDLHALWEYRELLYFLAWRDVKVRYKQATIGAAWAVLQPLGTMLVFVVVFSYFAKMPSDGVPYPIFAFTALLPWTYFSTVISQCGVSLISEANLLKKIYFPRLIVPIAAAVVPLVDFAVSFAILLGLMLWYGMTPSLAVLMLPVFLALSAMTALAVGLVLSALSVRYRDVKYTIPFLVQFWMFASPVIYPVSLVPEQWRWLYDLNPMAGVIEGFRWALLGTASPDFAVMGITTLVVAGLLFGGTVFFKNMERSFADVA
jgi:lipopolysaccharide transport system permease protein